MFYRVVLQGRAAGDHDLATVKREFARVTGLVGLRDRAVVRAGAALDPGRDNAGRRGAYRGHPSCHRRRCDGRARSARNRRVRARWRPRDPAARTPRSAHDRSRLRARSSAGTAHRHAAAAPAPGILLALSRGCATGAHCAGRAYTHRQRCHAHADSGEGPTTAKSGEAASADPPDPVEPPNARVLYGPWRCTNQSTGLSTYWTFGPDGTLVFHGDTLKESAARPGDPTIPIRWEFAEGRLVFGYANAPPVAYAVADLDLRQLRYNDGKGLDIQCRRP